MCNPIFPQVVKLVSIFWGVVLCLSNTSIYAQNIEKAHELDVLSYTLSLHADLETQSIKGNVQVRFLTDAKAQNVFFSCGNLKIDEVKGPSVKSFRQKDQKLILTLSHLETQEHVLDISYSGTPQKGLIFLAEPQEIYTVYFTSEWMPCHDSPADKATIDMDLFVPKNLKALASGDFIGTSPAGQDKVKYSFSQTYASPAYTYGCVIGDFQTNKEDHGETSLLYYAHKHNPEQLHQIFSKTGDIMSFLEDKAGLLYDQRTYSQILIGNHYQEMTGLSVLNESYGELVLADSTETNLITHELAHQWWGNRISCESWNHFWLNEGFATFLSAAYNEHRFGREKYMSDINSYHKVYTSIKKRGKDKSLVFKDWSNPSRDDRNLVYFKGAYVLHLLREEMGEQAFWTGIKFYSQSYFDKSVNTRNFQEAMEESAQVNLQDFFDKWIY